MQIPGEWKNKIIFDNARAICLNAFEMYTKIL